MYYEMDTFSKIQEKSTHMNKMFCTIRKWDYRGNRRYNPSKTNLHKQIHTLHRKLKKEDGVITSYSIERDKGKQQYHLHTIFHYTDENKLKEVLGKFIGGTITHRKDWFCTPTGRWIDDWYSGWGDYGNVWLEPIQSERNSYEYINKYEMSKTLV